MNVVSDGLVQSFLNSKELPKHSCLTSVFQPFEWSWYEAEVSLIDLKDGIVKKIYSKKDRQVAKPRLSPDNKKVTFLESLWSDRGVNSGDILSIDINSQKPKNLTEGDNESYSEVQWISENEFYTLSDCEGTFSLSLFLDGKRKVLWSKFGSVHKPWSPSFSISKDKAVISFESSRQPDEVILIDLKTKKEKILTSINKGLENCISYSSEKVEWKSKDGLEISGIFRTAGKNAPLMVIVHGGPTVYKIHSRRSIELQNNFPCHLPSDSLVSDC